jgi:hypothetical protein
MVRYLDRMKRHIGAYQSRLKVALYDEMIWSLT